MRRLIAHIGAHKTGSTAFQTWLQEHRAELLDAGYFVPVEGGTGNSAGLVKALYRADRPQRKVERFVADATRHASRDILLSAEHLNAVKGDELARVAAKFDELAGRKIAILVVRDQIAHFNSGFAQRGKAALPQHVPFNAFVEHALLAGRAAWWRKIEGYEANGFEMRVLPYNAAFRATGSARAIVELPDFGDLVDRFDWSATAHGNASMGAIGLIIMDLLGSMREDGDPEHRQRSTQQLRATVIRLATERFGDRPFNGFTRALRQRLLDHYRQGNAKVAERFFDAGWDDVLPPQSEMPVSPRSIDDLSPADAAAVRETAAEIMTDVRDAG